MVEAGSIPKAARRCGAAPREPAHKPTKTRNKAAGRASKSWRPRSPGGRAASHGRTGFPIAKRLDVRFLGAAPCRPVSGDPLSMEIGPLEYDEFKQVVRDLGERRLAQGG